MQTTTTDMAMANKLFKKKKDTNAHSVYDGMMMNPVAAVAKLCAVCDFFGKLCQLN